jgi:hypothetical protein
MINKANACKSIVFKNGNKRSFAVKEYYKYNLK